MSLKDWNTISFDTGGKSVVLGWSYKSRFVLARDFLKKAEWVLRFLGTGRIIARYAGRYDLSRAQWLAERDIRREIARAV